MSGPSSLPRSWSRRALGRAALAAGASALLSRGIVPARSAQRFTTPWMPYDAFETLELVEVRVVEGTLDVGIAPGDLAVSRDDIIRWVDKSAEVVTTYFGRFPVTRAKVLIVPVRGKGVTGGQAFGYRGAALRLMVGTASTLEDLLVRDWQMVHEMTHFALPRMPGGHNWLAEGIAVYVESIARAMAGHRSEAVIWAEFARDMPQGLPGAGDRGLDATPTWGRTYWGGAMFCLLADVEIRKRTQNSRGLADALRGVLAAGGSHEKTWPIGRILEVGDAATRASVLSELYADMGKRPVSPDLDGLWRELGVAARGGSARFDDTAPLAAIRRAITARPVTTL